MKFLLLLALSGLMALDMQGQILRGSISGKMERGKESLPGASVMWQGTNQGTVSDENGEYTIIIPEEIFANGTGRIVFSHLGFTQFTEVWQGQQSLDVVLEPLIIGEAEIITERKATEISLIDPLNSQMLTEKELMKAACCNLSESFETNASVDASVTDAVTGTAQIRMLGLDGKYTQIMLDVVPTVRGLSVLYGLAAIPGPWIESIQISKGVGSVSNGFESITGQLNLTMKNPENAEKLYVNAYANNAGRTELNAAVRIPVSERLLSLIQAHGEWNSTRIDHNSDGFLDNPLKKDIVLRNSWKLLMGKTGWEGEYSAMAKIVNQVSGQKEFRSIRHFDSDSLWGAELNIQGIDAYAKTGKLYKATPWKSFGTQFSLSLANHNGNFGPRNYSGRQESFRANLLYNSKIGASADHTFVAGCSIQYDSFNEALDSLMFVKDEQIMGGFFEYTWKREERFTLIAALRADNHNLFGWQFSPRLHTRYSITEKTSLKTVAGKGFRTANLLMEHVGILASNRRILVNGQSAGLMPNLRPEEAWNLGINLLHKFKLNYREGSASFDFYHTNFVNQAVLDLENPSEAAFFNLNGESWSNSFQAEFAWTPRRRVDLRLAYRWLEVMSDVRSGWLEKPFVARHRVFSNISWESKENAKGGRWKLDLTPQWIGESRLPSTALNPENYRLADRSQAYVLIHGQVTKVVKEGLDIYVGVENLSDFHQMNPIISAENPFLPWFDASMIWGPVFGRMVYAGLRYKIL
jgi:outer membrane receptor for ferrienterochelin and colicin